MPAYVRLVHNLNAFDLVGKLRERRERLAKLQALGAPGPILDNERHMIQSAQSACTLAAGLLLGALEEE